jgi:hypothetical protein
MKVFNKIFASLAVLAVLSWATVASATVTFTVTDMVGPFSIGGNSKMVLGVMDLSGTYATGGLAVTPAQLGLTTLQQIIAQPTDGYGATWLPSTSKIYLSSGGSQVSNGQSVSAQNINFIGIGW